MEETLGERLKRLRKAAGLTQSKLAAKVGLTQSAIGNIEAGTRGYGASVVLIAQALKTQPQILQAISRGHRNQPACDPNTLDSNLENSDRQPTNTITLDQALSVIGAWVSSSDDLTRDQVRPLINRLFEEPQRSAEIIARISATVTTTTPSTTTKKVGNEEMPDFLKR